MSLSHTSNLKLQLILSNSIKAISSQLPTFLQCFIVCIKMSLHSCKMKDVLINVSWPNRCALWQPVLTDGIIAEQSYWRWVGDAGRRWTKEVKSMVGNWKVTAGFLAEIRGCVPAVNWKIEVRDKLIAAPGRLHHEGVRRKAGRQRSEKKKGWHFDKLFGFFCLLLELQTLDFLILDNSFHEVVTILAALVYVGRVCIIYPCLWLFLMVPQNCHSLLPISRNRCP